jgi:hypothetical protein
LAEKPAIKGEAHGASQPAVPETAKEAAALEKQRALNRRVEITIISKPATGSGVPSPDAAGAPQPEVSVDKPPFPTLKPEDLFKPKTEAELANERLQRMLKEPVPTIPRHKQSLSGALSKKIDEVTGDVLRKFGVPEKFHGLIKDGVKAGIAKGATSALDAALDGAGVSGDKKKAIKKAIEAGVQTEIEF